MEIPALTTRELENFIKDEEGKILDIRPMEAYNGWALHNEQRGGHIPGAKSIPLKWTRYMDWVEVLEEKRILRNKPVVVYGYRSDGIHQMAEQLLELGYSKVAAYYHYTEEWAGNPGKPIDRLARYEQLVYPEWVSQLIKGDRPPSYNNDDYVLCHSHYDYIDDYEKGHIPGAIALNTNWLESTKTWNRRNAQDLRKKLEELGIRHDTTVVLYGRFSSPVFDDEKFPGKSAGHLGAIRCAAIMLYAGVEDVRILNGGITSWELDGYEVSTNESYPSPADDFGREIPARPEFMIDTPEAKEYIASDTAALVSIRSWREFIGEQSGYHYIEKKGRIPGAVFGNCGSDAYHMENYRNFDHTMREYQEVAEAWAEEGITPDKKLAFYCGTGWRGSEAFMNAYLMGWPNIAVYDGGWYEWSSDSNNQVATGVPE